MIPKSEIKKALETAGRVPGLYGRQESEFLYRLARRKGSLVELGCWMGRTTALLLQAAAVWNASLTTVDAFTPMPGKRQAATPDRWRANLRKVNLTPPRLLAMTTDQAAEVYPAEAQIALCFVDAAHGLSAVQSDLAHWAPRVKVGGVVALHDMFFPSITGVCQAVTAWWCAERDASGPKWKLLGLRDYTIAFRRLRW